MRSFRTDSPEFFVFELDGKTYKIPLATSMPVKDIEALSEAEGNGTGFVYQIDMLRKHMGKAVVDNLPSGVASDILKAWSEATQQTGASAGE